MNSNYEIDRLASLCRIDCTEEEKEYFSKNLQKIFQYISQLNEIDTTDIEPYTRPIETMVNVMRDDKEISSWTSEEFFRNVPEQISGLVKIPTVLKNEDV